MAAFSLSQLTSVSGGLAASIAVGAFLGQVVPGFTGAPEEELRRDTVIGGLGGLIVALIVIVLSAV